MSRSDVETQCSGGPVDVIDNRFLSNGIVDFERGSIPSFVFVFDGARGRAVWMGESIGRSVECDRVNGGC